jgi:periplasmic protein TonB
MHPKKLVHDVPRTDTTVVIIHPTDDPEDPVRRIETPPPPMGNTSAHLAPVITTEELDDTMTTIEDLTFTDPGATTHHGDPSEWGLPGDNGDIGDIIGEPEDEVVPFGGIAQPPVYPGGEAAMWEFLGSHLVYPDHARQIQLEGTVHVTFVVDQFGNVTKVKVPREIGGGLDEEAMRVVKMMPRWTPGKQNGRPVKVAFHLPIIFKLN